MLEEAPSNAENTLRAELQWCCGRKDFRARATASTRFQILSTPTSTSLRTLIACTSLQGRRLEYFAMRCMVVSSDCKCGCPAGQNTVTLRSKESATLEIRETKIQHLCVGDCPSWQNIVGCNLRGG